MASGGDMPQNLERPLGIALNVSNCDQEYHYAIGGLVTAWVRSPANDALEICAFEFPARTVGGPDLFDPDQRDSRKPVG